MADIHLDTGETMRLMADFSTRGLGQNPVATEELVDMRQRRHR
jgi:hypothetical protein